jgi:CubicO group peptidase (beta-lactamase class C family)
MTNPGRKIEGYVHPDFAHVAVMLEKVTPKGGAAISIYHRGEPVVDLWTGTRDAAGAPWRQSTLSLSFSVTKSITATALHILADRGLIDYDQPVSTYWPEFAQGGKQAVTVRQLLCHQGGLYPIRKYVDHVDRMTDWAYMTDVLARATPEHEAGARHGYHGLTFGWLIGELVQRVSGKPLGEFVTSEIAEPLGLDGLHIGTPEHLHSQVASTLRPAKPIPIDKLRPTGRRIESVMRALRAPFSLKAFVDAHLPNGMETFDWDRPDVLSSAIPAANGVFTARSLARLYAALGRGGELDGARILSEAALARATEAQSTKRDYVLLGTKMSWRLGYHQAFSTRGGIESSFGHLGANGACAWADPSEELAVGFTRNHGMRDGFPYLSTVRISGAALRCARERRR